MKIVGIYSGTLARTLAEEEEEEYDEDDYIFDEEEEDEVNEDKTVSSGHFAV